MKPNELRIGNLVHGLYDGDADEDDKMELCKILSIDSVGISEHTFWVDGESGTEYYSSFEPIPLTSEWLEKFGFDESNEIKFSEDSRICWDEINGIHIFILDQFQYIKHIKHVHQLQNLYFALTGNELETK